MNTSANKGIQQTLFHKLYVFVLVWESMRLTFSSMSVILMINLSFPLETESENEFRPLDGRIDEFHPKATRTLFIGNLEKTTSYQQLLDIFQRFGEIVVCYHSNV